MSELLKRRICYIHFVEYSTMLKNVLSHADTQKVSKSTWGTGFLILIIYNFCWWLRNPVMQWKQWNKPKYIRPNLKARGQNKILVSLATTRNQFLRLVNPLHIRVKSNIKVHETPIQCSILLYKQERPMGAEQIKKLCNFDHSYLRHKFLTTWCGNKISYNCVNPRPNNKIISTMSSVTYAERPPKERMHIAFDFESRSPMDMALGQGTWEAPIDVATLTSLKLRVIKKKWKI